MAALTLPPSREAFRQAVAAVAAKAHEKLPACAGRIDSAVRLVLLGEVTLLPDGSATVGSCTDPTKSYSVNGTCTCQDYARAPGNLCKHRLAYGIMRRATELVPEVNVDPLPACPPSASPCPTAQPLPEAPASANCHIMIAGRQVQLTLRDTDEARLLVRLEEVLQRYPLPAAPVAPQGQGKGWCAKHQVTMQQTTKNGRSWYSHKTADGQWCQGK